MGSAAIVFGVILVISSGFATIMNKPSHLPRRFLKMWFPRRRFYLGLFLIALGIGFVYAGYV